MSINSNISNEQLWQTTEQQLLRAERLIERAAGQLQHQNNQHQYERARIGLEIERVLVPLSALNSGMLQIIETMAKERQDSRIQSWQAKLQELLGPVDEAELQLQELLLQLESPSTNSLPEQNLTGNRPVIQRLQMQQLLAQRQRQVQQLQAELRELKAAKWSGEKITDIPQEPPAAKPTPGIFS
jgi:hypothetical protein